MSETEKINPRDVGVVVQGPLVSVGRSGETHNIPLSAATKDDIVEFDSIPNILNLYKKAPNKAYFVVVAWGSERPELLDRLKGLMPESSVVLVEDTAPEIRPKSEVIPGNNKYRQILGTLAGLEILRDRGCKTVVKIRSDQNLDVNQLVENTVSNCNNDRQLTVAALNPRLPASLPDFYFGGDVALLEDCLRATLRPVSERASVHYELFWKWGNRVTKVRLPWLLFPFRELMHSRNVEIWRHFGLASRGVYESMIWRGKPMRVINPSFLFSGETKTDSGPTYLDFQSPGFKTVAHTVVNLIFKLLSAARRTGQRR